MDRVASRESADLLLAAATSTKERTELESILATRMNPPSPGPDEKKGKKAAK